jgi:opacity protein-like surface antigen
MRRIAVTALVLSLSFVGVGDLLAQRSGFIVGFGIGVGLTSIDRYSTPSLSPYSGPTTSAGYTQGAFATDFKIGAQVNPSLQIYYLFRSNWFSPESSTDLIVAGISALGVTYLPSPKVQLSGGLGLYQWTELHLSPGGCCVEFYSASRTLRSFGLTGGVGYEFTDHWLLDVAVTYGKPDGVSVWELRAGISVLSH